MSEADAFRAGPDPQPAGPSTGPGLLDLLGVAAVVLDDEGRIALWSPQAQELFGYTPRRCSAGTRRGSWSTSSTWTWSSPSSTR